MYLYGIVGCIVGRGGFIHQGIYLYMYDGREITVWKSSSDVKKDEPWKGY